MIKYYMEMASQMRDRGVPSGEIWQYLYHRGPLSYEEIDYIMDSI